jgi:hypothetical protein
MKYREVSTMCSKGCGRERAGGQRYCKECRAAAERERRARRHAEHLELVAFKAASVAAQIDRFNAASVQ